MARVLLKSTDSESKLIEEAIDAELRASYPVLCPHNLEPSITQNYPLLSEAAKSL